MMDFDEIKKNVEISLNDSNHKVKFSDDDDYHNRIVFIVVDGNNEIVVPEQRMPISRISNKATLDNFLTRIKKSFGL